MKLIAEKYWQLKPTIELLSDEVIIAQAWKKTHTYMRAYNWYADTLALDISALGIEYNAKKWADGILKTDIGLQPLELIPAAKSEKWVVDVDDGWIPESLANNSKSSRTENPPLRPLAHLKVREQTWATALMLCLADIVETAQGDCSESDFFKAQKKSVYSYGNRLICDWKKDTAWFRWGNSETYRKFFTDYQNFLKRPVYIGNAIANSQFEDDHVYVINLDLSKFYDHIDRSQLLERLKILTRKFDETKLCSKFWSSAEKIIHWEWSSDSILIADKLGLILKDGLPQGLVSSGFFANAYLFNFDKYMGEQIGKMIPNSSGVILHDYCRYVDDLRLVISVESDVEKKDISKLIYNWISGKLKKEAGDTLTINEGKTQVIALSDLNNSGSLSERVANLQREISGPADRDTLEGVMGVLEGLLTLQTDGLPKTTRNKTDEALLSLAKFDHDVRSDTLKRFAANRLESVMRNKRKLGNSYVKVEGKNSDPIDNESELLAKKLIWAWMQDPSLALVLRKAIEIYPSLIIAEPVFESIFKRCSCGSLNVDVVTTATADYLLADLFRSCVDFHGFFQRIDYPISSDPDAVLALASRYAQKALISVNIPKFIERQALLLLAVMQKPVLLPNYDATIQHGLHAILSSMPIKLFRQKLALYEVAAQITGNSVIIATLLVEHMKNADDELKEKVLDEFSKRGGEFWLSLWKQLNKDKSNKTLLSKYKWSAPLIGGDPKPIQQRLSKLIVSKNNGFVHEAAMIKLALALLNGLQKNELVTGISPSCINVTQQQTPKASWDKVWKPGILIHCKTNKISHDDPRFIIPQWVNKENSDAEIIYWIGTILRAAVIGNNDFTSSRWKKSKVQGYKGLRTGWFKRRMGMMHAPEALVGEFATLSDWAAELLMKCLQWPGFESTYVRHKDIEAIVDLESFGDVLKERLNVLNDLYCKASEMPTLITRARRPEGSHNQKFRLVTVQQLLPNTKDFSVADPKLDSSHIRAQHRDHLSRICQLTYKTLITKIEADGDDTRPCADLIVFPEVGVHIDDQDLIKQLADKTRSMVFAGLVFTDNDGKLINIARWFIPDYRESGRQWVIRDQGKKYPTNIEVSLGVTSFRPCQHIVELEGVEDGPFFLSGSICYDATDLKLVSDLKGKSDLFIVIAHNKDVSTFDTMASALHYHMYQHVVLVNKGEFGGSTIQAPYREQYERLISHAHGVDQISINVADLDLAAFKRKTKTYKKVKTKPAGS